MEGVFVFVETRHSRYDPCHAPLASSVLAVFLCTRCLLAYGFHIDFVCVTVPRPLFEAGDLLARPSDKMPVIPTTEQVQYMLQHIDDDQTTSLHVSSGVMMAATTAAVILRFFARRSGESDFGRDDYCLFLGYVGVLPWTEIKVNTDSPTPRLVLLYGLRDMY